MTTNQPAQPARWTGDMLNSPEKVAIFAEQIRRLLREYVQLVSLVRGEAEAMWEANLPKEYGALEALLRHRQVAKPFSGLQKDLERAVRRTFELEARYRRVYHEIPDERRAARGHHKALTSGASTARPAVSAPRPEQTEPDTEPVDFLTLLKQQQHGRRRTA
ncbi:MAG TPA: hypothetical protein VKZ89_09440 [Thermobifida alba]|nr:hypothetical protein [Thermobifida alba]